MNKRSRYYKWLMGFETRKVRCPDGNVRVMTFGEYTSWQDAWSRRDAAALARFEVPGATGRITPEPAQPAPPSVSVTERTGAILAKGLIAAARAKGYAR